jgi:hypothetical protein
MSTRVCRAEFAVTADGEVVLNLSAISDVTGREDLLRIARRLPGAIFIGVTLTHREYERLMRRIRKTLPDVMAPIAGRRYWKK